MSTEIIQSLNDYCASQGLVFRAEIGATIAVATTGTYNVGLVTPPGRKIRVLARAYSSSESPLTVNLHRTTWTGGSNVRTLNRDLSASQVPPAQLVGGVTPGTLGAIITGVTLRAPTVGGTAAVSIQADENALILEPSTSYVIQFINGGGVNAVIGAAIDTRLALPGE